MQQIIKAFPFGVLLRNFFSGVLFIAGYLRSQDLPPGIKFDGAGVAVGVSVALCAGVFVYAIHRTTVNALIEWIRYSESVFRFRRRFPLISNRAAGAMISRWDGSVGKDESKAKVRASSMTVWADYIHLLYTASLCIISGSLVACFVAGERLPVDPLLTSITGILFLAGLLSDWRRHRIEDILNDPLKALKDPKKETEQVAASDR